MGSAAESRHQAERFSRHSLTGADVFWLAAIVLAEAEGTLDKAVASDCASHNGFRGDGFP